MAANDDLSPWAVEDLNCFAFGSIHWILGVDLSLEGSDFSGLLSCELELKLQSMGIADAANDERATKGLRPYSQTLSTAVTPSISMERIRPSSGPVRRPTALMLT